MTSDLGRSGADQGTVRLLIADDHKLFREGMRAILAGVDWIEVVGEAGTGRQAIEACGELEPDVVLMDIHMPELNGIEATRQLVTDAPELAIIIVTMLEEDASLFAAMRAGARGYLLKGSGKREVLRAVEAVASGGAIFGPTVAARLIDFFNSLENQPTEGAAAQVFPELTERELEILTYLATGENKREIAERLFLSPKTISNHLSHIYNKLQVADRAEAILRARKAGLGRSGTAAASAEDG
ncbi:MAG: response regulator transcription factor [Anaerolineales bacterium]